MTLSRQTIDNEGFTLADFSHTTTTTTTTSTYHTGLHPAPTATYDGQDNFAAVETSSTPSTATMASTPTSTDPSNGFDPEKDIDAAEKAPYTHTTVNAKLPDGCNYGDLSRSDGSVERVIWVDFAPGSRENPFYFSRSRKLGITIVATFFTFMTAYTTAAYAISAKPMCAELGCGTVIVEGGVALYAFGFGIFPLVLAPLSEEFGRRWTYTAAVFIFMVFQIPIALAKNSATVLVDRFLLGAAGSVGATLVGGTISDIYVPSKRGLPMALFGFCAIFGTGAGATTMAWVVERVGWRWVHWAQMIAMGIFFPIVVVVMRETRATVLLRRKAHQLRVDRGMADGARYLARSEIDKDKFLTAIMHSISRPIVFLVTEPIVTFFSLWVALGWGVFYTQIAGIPYTFQKLHGFGIIGVGQVYWTICLGGVLGFGANFIQEHIYRKKAPKYGVEARLYAPMVAGILFALGCFVTGFTSLSYVHWIGPCVGVTMVLTAVMIIYITAFTYLSECYGAYASSAIAGQSFLRNMFGGSFSFFTEQMFEAMTVRWALVMMGGVAALLALVPFIAFFYGPQLRARSKYSRLLMQQERDAIEKERREREARGMDTTEAEDLEGDANEETMERAMSHAMSVHSIHPAVPV